MFSHHRLSNGLIKVGASKFANIRGVKLRVRADNEVLIDQVRSEMPEWMVQNCRKRRINPVVYRLTSKLGRCKRRYILSQHYRLTYPWLQFMLDLKHTAQLIAQASLQ